MNAVLHIDDREEELQTLRNQLAGSYRVTGCSQGRNAAAIIERRRPDAVLLDIDMPGYDGFRVLSDIRSMRNPPPVLMLSAHTQPTFVKRALWAGAADFISKPYVSAMLRRILDRVLVDGHPLQHPPREADTDPNRLLVGSSPAMESVRKTIERYANSDVPVLILGESGTGKDRAARLLHALSARSAGPFEVRNIGAMPESIAESELFGCESGAFTDARERSGCFEAAHGGTLFLDEIADAGPATQTALLRIVEDGLVRRLGATKQRKVDCRLIFATNSDLNEMAGQKTFRQDLLFRINTLQLVMPPLRERAEDIPELVELFLADNNLTTESIQPQVIDFLRRQPWPGNVRQLKSCIDRAVVLAANEEIGPAHIRL